MILAVRRNIGIAAFQITVTNYTNVLAGTRGIRPGLRRHAGEQSHGARWQIWYPPAIALRSVRHAKWRSQQTCQYSCGGRQLRTPFFAGEDAQSSHPVSGDLVLDDILAHAFRQPAADTLRGRGARHFAQIPVLVSHEVFIDQPYPAIPLHDATRQPVANRAFADDPEQAGFPPAARSRLFAAVPVAGPLALGIDDAARVADEIVDPGIKARRCR